MSGHTPGPWDWFTNGGQTYLATPNRGRLYVMGFARQGMQGAGPRFAHWGGMDAGAPRERMGGVMEDGPFMRDGSLHPDARLIAAAPELLEVAVGVMAWWEEHQYDTTGDRNVYDVDPEFVVLARTAIAKATGAA